MTNLSWKGKAALAGGISFLVSAVAAHVGGVVINSTPSEPLGIWRKVEERSFSYGDMVLACPPRSPIMDIAVSRHYLPSGSCPGHLGTVMKQVVGVAGDLVEIRADGLLINGVWFSHAPLATKDSEGRPLSSWGIGKHLLSGNEIFLGSNYTDKSFDSRYFGAIPVASIRAKLSPVLITSWKPNGF